MDEFLRALDLGENVTSSVSLMSVIISCLLSAGLSSLVGVVYRRVHRESGYSQSLVHSLVTISMITALIMAIIGSNIARAFSLVGALSIIRFRSAIKSPFDVTIIFLSIALGMAAGTGFYGIAIVACTIICAVIVLMHELNFGATPSRSEYLLSVIFPGEENFETAMADILKKFFSAYHLTYMEVLAQGKLREVVYSVRPQSSSSDHELLEAIRKVNGGNKVSYKAVRHAIEVP